MAMLIGLVVMTGMYAMFQWFPIMFTQMSRSDKMLSYNMMLASSMDYFKYSIRNRWNWTELGTKAAEPKTLEEAVTAPFYLERLIFGTRFVEDPNTGANVQLKRAVTDK